MSTSIHTADLEAILILGGEGADYSRSKRAIMLARQITAHGSPHPYLIPTGKHSGMVEPTERFTHAENSRQYLVSQGVPSDYIIPDERAKDTLAEMIYAREDIQKTVARNIGIITSGFHMKRAIWCANRVWPKDYRAVALPVDDKASLMRHLTEFGTLVAYALDTMGIEKGNNDAWLEYLEKKHPFHAERPKLSFYRFGVFGLKTLQKLRATEEYTR